MSLVMILFGASCSPMAPSNGQPKRPSSKSKEADQSTRQSGGDYTSTQAGRHNDDGSDTYQSPGAAEVGTGGSEDYQRPPQEYVRCQTKASDDDSWTRQIESEWFKKSGETSAFGPAKNAYSNGASVIFDVSGAPGRAECAAYTALVPVDRSSEMDLSSSIKLDTGSIHIQSRGVIATGQSYDLSTTADVSMSWFASQGTFASPVRRGKVTFGAYPVATSGMQGIVDVSFEATIVDMEVGESSASPREHKVKGRIRSAP